MKNLFKLIDNLDDISYLFILQEYLHKKPFHLLLNNNDGFTPFTYTLANKKLSTFRILYDFYIQNKMVFQNISDVNIINLRDGNNNRPIDIVGYLKDKDDRLEKLKFLVDNTDVNINLQDKTGNTLLHTLTKKNDDNAVEFIRYTNKANVNILNDFNQTPIYYAINNKNQNILDLLIEAGGILQGHIGSKYINYRDLIIRSQDPNLIEYLMEYDKISQKRLKTNILKSKKKEFIRIKYKQLCSILKKDNIQDVQKFATELNIDTSNKSKEELCSQIARKVVIREYNPNISFRENF